MRSLRIQVPAAAAARILELAMAHGARSPAAVAARGAADGADAAADDLSMVFVDIPNERVGRFVEAVGGAVDDATFSLMPIGTLPLATPLETVHESVRDVSSLSTMEITASALQSIGSWRGMLVYSALAGIVGSYGLIFEASYVLVAAMLINPMGAPAVVSVIGVALGDRHMFARGGIRFVVSLAVQAIAALALGLAYGLSVATGTMEQVTSLSTWSVLLALAAGAAGAHTQLQSERDSLVSGTAAGFMVAAALAPPAAVLGLSVAIGRWEYPVLMAFLLALQYVAIGVGGWLALHLAGLRPGDHSLGRGSVMWRSVLASAAAAAVVGLVWLQTTLAPRFTKADLSRTALEIVRDAVDASDVAALVESSARFTRPELQRYAGETLLFDIVVEPAGADVVDDAAVEADIRARVQRLVATRMTDVVPLIRISVVPGPQPHTR